MRRLPSCERDKVCGIAYGQACGRLQCTATAAEGMIKEGSACGRVNRRDDIAQPVLQTLGILELAEFIGDTDLNVGIRADAKVPAGVEKGRGGENAVAEVRFRDGAEPGGRAALSQAANFVFCHVGGVDQSPARINRGVIQQPLHRPRAGPGEAILNLFCLLGRMNVDRPADAHGGQRREFLGRDGPETVRGDAERGAGQRRDSRLASGQQFLKTINITNETTLPVRGRSSAKSRMGVEHRQQCQADSGVVRRGGDALRHFGDIGIGPAVVIVMQVMEFAHSAEAGFQHFHIKLASDSLHVVGRHGEGKAVHLGAPAPEIVVDRSAHFCQPGHAALKGVAVDVGHAGNENGTTLILRIGRNRVFEGGDKAVFHGETHIAAPAIGGQSGLGMNTDHAFILSGLAKSRVVVLVSFPQSRASFEKDGRLSDIPADVRSAGEIHLWSNARLATMSPMLPGIGAVHDGVIAAQHGRIMYAGRESELPAELSRASRMIDCQGRWITPGLIDCHTHLVYAGDRAQEFEMRLAGATYEEIARAGGGILSSVKALRAADEDVLVRQSLPRLETLIAEGVTTVEIKSGYGLDLKNERKSLVAARRMAAQRDVTIVTTFLGAHALPPEANGDRAAYIDSVIQRMLPALASEGLADAVDGFCEHLAFSPEEMRRVFAAALQHGLPVKLHADQLSNLHGAALAAEFGALSVDHLEFTDESGVAAMARSGTVAVMLPGAYYFIREKQKPPIEMFRRHHVPMAVATDSNPGTSPLTSLLLAMNMAATLFGMTVEECLLGTTRHAARALGRLADSGTLEAGKWADFAIWNVERPAELVYRIGFCPLQARVWHGIATHGSA